MSYDAVSEELAFRMSAWRELLERGGPSNVDRGLIRDLKMYGGAQGVWVDANRTRLIADGGGVAVGLLHTGRHYADDLSPTGILYHYPHTNRGPGRDASEVAATKRAAELALPVFVITPAVSSRSRRDVHLAWIVDWDDAEEIFLVTFTDDVAPPNESAPAAQVSVGQTFKLFDEDVDTRKVEVSARPNQQRFKFDVLARYGAACAVCDIGVSEVLDAIHIADKGKKGTDHPENGLILCATHHRAFDARLFCIEPGSLQIRSRKTSSELRMTRTSIAHLKAQPNREALEWRWERWPDRDGLGGEPAA